MIWVSLKENEILKYYNTELSKVFAFQDQFLRQQNVYKGKQPNKTNSYVYSMTILESVPSHPSIRFRQFLIKIHRPVRKVQLKLKKGKISKISSLTYYFSFWKIHRNKHKFLMEIYDGKCLHFSPNGSHLEYLAQFFNVIISFAMLNSCRP